MCGAGRTPLWFCTGQHSSGELHKSCRNHQTLENTFRAVNIGLVNEMAMMCDRMGIDIWEVIDAATKHLVMSPAWTGY